MFPYQQFYLYCIKPYVQSLQFKHITLSQDFLYNIHFWFKNKYFLIIEAN